MNNRYYQNEPKQLQQQQQHISINHQQTTQQLPPTINITPSSSYGNQQLHPHHLHTHDINNNSPLSPPHHTSIPLHHQHLPLITTPPPSLPTNTHQISNYMRNPSSQLSTPPPPPPPPYQYSTTLPNLQALPPTLLTQPNSYSLSPPPTTTMQRISSISPTNPYSPGSRPISGGGITLPPLSSPTNTSNASHRFLFSSSLPHTPSSSGGNHFSSATDVYQHIEPRSPMNLNASPIHYSDHLKFHLPSINNSSSYGMGPIPTSPEPSSLHYISSPYSKSIPPLKQTRQSHPASSQQYGSPKPPIPFVNISSSYQTTPSTPTSNQIPPPSYHHHQQHSPPPQPPQYIEQITSPPQNVYVYNNNSNHNLNQINSQTLMDSISIEPLNNNKKNVNSHHHHQHQNTPFPSQKKRSINQEHLYQHHQQQQQQQQQQDTTTTSFKMYEKPMVPKAMLSNYDLKALESSPINPEFNEKDFPELQGNFKILDKVGQGTFSGVFKSVCLKGEHRGRLVALKRVSPTSSPTRILNEIKTLMKVGEDRYISQLLGIIRYMDQVTLILPYFEHDSFKDYFFKLTPNEFKNYLIAIFSALKHVHHHQICHRDVKPTNFLYNQKLNSFMLIDFGLAQEMPQEVQPHKDVKKMKKSKDDKSTTNIRNNQNNCSPLLLSQQQQQQQNDISKQAPRAGTRGFRAPEVLLKYNKQTTAIDIWSVGVIMMCVLSGRYPFFVSPDDLTSLAEIISIIGTKKIIDLANSLEKEIQISENIRGQSWTELAKALRNESGLIKERMPEEAFQLLELCLEPCPMKRVTAADALCHPFLTS